LLGALSMPEVLYAVNLNRVVFVIVTVHTVGMFVAPSSARLFVIVSIGIVFQSAKDNVCRNVFVAISIEK
jgi:hypothetical protein